MLSLTAGVKNAPDCVQRKRVGPLQRVGHVKNTPWITDGLQTTSANMLAAAAATVVASICRLLLPALFVVVVVFGAAAGGGPLGAAVLLGLLQELVQTEGILFKLNGPLSPLAMVCTQKVFIWDEPNGHKKTKQKKTLGDSGNSPS